MEWFILPQIDLTGIDDGGYGTNNQPVFRATTTCPSPTPFFLAGVLAGAAIAYFLLKK
jgi:hypothetical protein